MKKEGGADLKKGWRCKRKTAYRTKIECGAYGQQGRKEVNSFFFL